MLRRLASARVALGVMLASSSRGLRKPPLVQQQRAYQATIAVLLFLLLGHVAYTHRRAFCTPRKERGPAIHSVAETSHQPLATQLYSAAGDQGSSSAQVTPTVGVWPPPTTRQSYSAVPSIGSGPWSHMQFLRATFPPVGPEKGSVLERAFLSTPVGYGTHFVPSVANDGLSAEFVPRPACQRDTDLLQNYLYSLQHPPNCKTARILLRRHAPQYGMFASLSLATSFLFLASVLQRTLVDQSLNAYFHNLCASNNLECATLPLSSCGKGDFSEEEVCYDESCWDSARVISIDRAVLTDFLPCAPTAEPRGRCNKSGGPLVSSSLAELVPGLGKHGEQFLQSEFYRYVTRPNRLLSEFTAGAMRDLGLTNEIISVHVRHGDKNEGIQFPTQAYALVVRRAVQITGLRTVFIGSDDRKVFDDLGRYVDLPGIEYKYLDPDANPVVHSANQAAIWTRGRNKMAKMLGAGADKLPEGGAAEAGGNKAGAAGSATEDGAAASSSPSSSSLPLGQMAGGVAGLADLLASPPVHTMGLSLLAQGIIMGQSQVYIGTRSSNAGQLAYSMQNNDCSTSRGAKIGYDMYGDLYYNSWYCRSDIQHAGREWMCALRKPVQGYIWTWGGAETECPEVVQE